MNKFLLLAIGLMAFAACSPKIKDAEVDYFAKATALKAESEAIQLSIKDTIQSLHQERNAIMVQGRTLTAQELKFVETVNDILTIQGKYHQFQDDIAKSEDAYEPNGKELLYLNEQALKLAKQVQKKLSKQRQNK